MTESEWLESRDPELLIDWITTGGGPIAGQHKLHCIEDVVFDRFGLTLDDLVVQDEPPAGACDIIRDIVGNPFRPVELPLCEGCYGQENHGASGNANWRRSECPRCFGVGRSCPWLTPSVLSLAHAAYNISCRGCDRCYDGWLPGECIRPCPNRTNATLDPSRLMVLADALEEVGCDNLILSHLRSPGPHWRGCWVLDLLLGKS